MTLSLIRKYQSRDNCFISFCSPVLLPSFLVLILSCWMPSQCLASPEPETLPETVGMTQRQERWREVSVGMAVVLSLGQGWRGMGADAATVLPLSPGWCQVCSSASTWAGSEQVPGCLHWGWWHMGQPGKAGVRGWQDPQAGRHRREGSKLWKSGSPGKAPGLR